MSASKPIVYLLQAEDEFSARQFIAAMEKRLGAEGMADLNLQRLDGRQITLETLREDPLPRRAAVCDR